MTIAEDESPTQLVPGLPASLGKTSCISRAPSSIDSVDTRVSSIPHQKSDTYTRDMKVRFPIVADWRALYGVHEV